MGERPPGLRVQHRCCALRHSNSHDRTAARERGEIVPDTFISPHGWRQEGLRSHPCRPRLPE